MAERTSQADHEEKGLGQQDQEQSSPGNQPEDTIAVGESTDAHSVEDPYPTKSEEDSECPGCQSLGVLTLPCGHKLCPMCIELSKGELGQAGCTICYGSQLMDSVLHTLLDALFQGQPRRHGVASRSVEESVWGAIDEGQAGDGYGGVEIEDQCVQHGEMLSVFCLEEEKPLCQQCQTDEHEQHQCCSIQEAVLDCKVR